MGDPTFAGTLEPVALIAGGADAAHLWARSRWPSGRWGRAARSAICKLLDGAMDGLGGLPADIIERVDASYPFGARPPAGPSFPYKAWLSERKTFIAAITPPTMPSADEIAACAAAEDELSGEVAQRRTMAEVLAELDRLAPNRHARPCGPCGAKPGRPCIEPDPDVVLPLNALQRREFIATGHVTRARPIPHHARLVGHLDAGPLFTSRSA